MRGARAPPRTPASWYPSEAPLYRSRVLNSSAMNAACGPYIRSEEHTSELQSRRDLVCRLLLERSGTPRHLHSFPTRRSSDLHRAHVDGDRDPGVEPAEQRDRDEGREGAAQDTGELVPERSAAVPQPGAEQLGDERGLWPVHQIGRAHV